MESNLRNLKAIYDRSAEYIKYLGDAGLMGSEKEVSEFWAKIFSDPARVNYPDFNAVLAMRRGATFPLADEPQIDEATDLAAAHAAHSVVSLSVPREFLRSINESVAGCPRCFDIDGAVLSAGGMINAMTTYRILEALKRRQLDGKPLRILEIGAGYGQVAFQLCSLLKVTSYTIIDLPENLFLSSFYLQTNFPERSSEFIRSASPAGQAAQGSFRFLTPPLIDALEDEYDLILNTYSFQEMPLESVQRYFRLAKERLSPQGIFYSLNSHGKSGVRVPADYDTPGFEWLGFAPVRRIPHHHFVATTPYEMVFGKAVGGASKKWDPVNFSALASIMQLGVFDDIMPLCESFVAGSLGSADSAWLKAAAQFFQASVWADKQRQIQAMRDTGVLTPVADYVHGCAQFAEGKWKEASSSFLGVLPHFEGSLVDARISLYLAASDRNARNWLERAQKLVPHLRADLNYHVGNLPNLQHEVARELHLTVARTPVRRLKTLLNARF